MILIIMLSIHFCFFFWTTKSNFRLGQLWFFLKYCDKKYVEYALACKKEKIFEQVERNDVTIIHAHCLPKGVEIKTSTFELINGSSSSSAAAGSSHKRSSKDQQADSDHAHKRSKKPSSSHKSTSAHDKMDLVDDIKAAAADSSSHAPKDSKAKHATKDDAAAAVDPEVLAQAKASLASFLESVDSIPASATSNNNKNQDDEQTADATADVSNALSQEKQLTSQFEDKANWNEWSQTLFENDRHTLAKLKKREVPIPKKTKNKQLAIAPPTASSNNNTTVSAAALQAQLAKQSKLESVKFEYTIDIMAQIRRVEKQQRDAQKKLELQQQQQQSSQQQASQQQTQQGGSSQHDNVWKKELGIQHDFMNIDTSGSNFMLGSMSSSFNVPGEGSSSAAASSGDNSSQQQQTASQQQSSQSQQPSSSAPAASVVQNNSKPSASMQVTPSKSSSKSNRSNNGGMGASDSQKKKKFIVVPAALSSLITMYNVKDFLELGNFVTSDEKKKNYKEKPNAMNVKHVRDNKQVEEFVVIDNPQKLLPEELSRIVAVFTAGQAWQFKGWYNGNPTDVLSKYKSFYLAYHGETVPPSVQAWPVKILKIGKGDNRRHTDSIVVREFWSLVDPQ